MRMLVNQVIMQAISGKDLVESQATEIMEQIMEGLISPVQLAALITALKIKGEAVDEITGFAAAMRKKVAPTKLESLQLKDTLLVDTCGTGGDGSGTFNISTAAALVVAGAGVTVAKHGNRSVSSKCGSADVLEALGVNVALEPAKVLECLEEIGLGFLFAPIFHPAMKHAASTRKELGFRSIFNLLGPLTNPFGAKCQVLGVYQPHLTETMARVLKKLGSQSAFVVHGRDGLDEITVCDTTRITQLSEGEITTFEFDPREVGINLYNKDVLLGDSPEANGKIIRDILDGKTGPNRDVVVLNSGFALLAVGSVNNINQGVALAQEVIDSGKAKLKLSQLINFTQKEVA